MVSEFIEVDKYSSKQQTRRQEKEAEYSYLETQVGRLGTKPEDALYF